jgi:hypothetical protein
MKYSDPVQLRRGVLKGWRDASQRSYPKCATPNSATNEAGKFAANNPKMIPGLIVFIIQDDL